MSLSIFLAYTTIKITIRIIIITQNPSINTYYLVKIQIKKSPITKAEAPIEVRITTFALYLEEK